MESTSQQLQRGTSSATVAAAASGGKAVYDKSLAAGVFPDDSCQEGLEEELEEELRTKPLLDSVRSLVNKERELASLQLEEKERETELWRERYLDLQNKTGDGYARAGLGKEERAHADRPNAKLNRGGGGDWDDIQAARKQAGDASLRRLRARESLDFSRRSIGPQDLDGLVAKLKWLRGFTSVNLSSNDIDERCAASLAKLMALRQLRQLDLGRNDIGPSAGKAILNSLSRCRDLQVLRMDANMPFARTPGIGAVFANALAAAVKAGGCRNLWHLRITLEDFDNAFFTIPRTSGHSAGLGRRRAAQPLERSSAGENVGDEREDKKRRGSKATAAVVARHTSIPPPRSGPVHPMNALALARAFHPRAPNGGAGASLLDNRGTHAAGYDSRGRAGQARGAITSLELPYARLHLQTVEVIATHAISSLTNLDLTYCYIGPAGARALARALDAGNAANSDGDSSSVGARGRGSTSLRSLRMPHNAIGDSGAHAFSYALKTNRCLTFLSLASNGIGPAGGRTLASALRGEGIALTQLDIGDNPLGESSARMLVLAAVDTHKARDDGGHGGATRLQISGLDEVAGVSVAMKETMRRAARGGVTSATNAEGVDKDSAGIIPTRRVAWGDSVSRDEHEAPSLLQVGPAVSLRPDDADQDDGFIQAYQVLLDSRFQSTGKGENRGGVTLDIRWWFASISPNEQSTAATSAPLGACEWRVTRCRKGDPEFLVKEGASILQDGTTSGEGSIADLGSSTVTRDDRYSLFQTLSNGWKEDDVLKIFVRGQNRERRSSCCDLTVRKLREDMVLSETSYDLLWADVDESSGMDSFCSGWLREDSPHTSPTLAERAHVAYQMSHTPLTATGESRLVKSGAAATGNSHRLRQVFCASGGRVSASWESMLLFARHREHRLPVGSDNVDERAPSGYSWAIVRTRGVIGGDEGAAQAWAGNAFAAPPQTSRVIEQGFVGRCYPLNPSAEGTSTTGQAAVTGSRSGNDDGAIRGHEGAASPWCWRRLEAQTNGWLPGDLLSLWIQLHYSCQNPPPPPSCNSIVVGSESNRLSQDIGNATGGIGQGSPSMMRAYPRVQGFETRLIDDVEAQKIAARACFLPRHNHHQRYNFIAGGKAPELGRVPTRSGLAGSWMRAGAPSERSTAAVRLDFAAVCPMNMAAAGGSWA